MAADGEVEIQVHAEGADEAADELAEGGDTGASGGGGGEGFAGIGTSLKSIVRLLGVMTAITSALEPLLKLVEGILEINKAFWAPVAMMMMRLFQPVLRRYLKILPVWYDFLNTVGPYISDAVSFLADLPGTIWNLLQQGFAWIQTKLTTAVDWLRSLPRRLWEFIQQLPAMLARRIQNAVPGAGDIGSGDTARDVAQAGGRAAGGAAGEAGVTIAMSGGLETLIDRIEKESGLSFP